MPNWCQNRLTISNAPEAFFEFVKDGLSFEKIAPTPPELLTVPAPCIDDKLAEAMIAKYSAADWHLWRIANWGTKWDIANEKIVPNKIDSVFFDTAWSPPIEAMAALSKMFPEMTIVLDYYEQGMEFAGCATIENGVVDDITADTDEAVRLIAQDVFMMEFDEEEIAWNKLKFE